MHRDLHRKKRDSANRSSMASSVSSEDEQINYQSNYPGSISSSTPTPTMSSRNLTDYDMMTGGSTCVSRSSISPPLQHSSGPNAQHAMFPWEVYSTDVCSPLGSSSQQSLYEDRSDDDSDDFDPMNGYWNNPTPEQHPQHYPAPQSVQQQQSAAMPMMMSSADYVVMAKGKV